MCLSAALSFGSLLTLAYSLQNRLALVEFVEAILPSFRRNDRGRLRRRSSAVDSSDDAPNLCRAQLPSAIRDELVPETSFGFVNSILGLARSQLKGLSLAIVIWVGKKVFLGPTKSRDGLFHFRAPSGTLGLARSFTAKKAIRLSWLQGQWLRRERRWLGGRWSAGGCPTRREISPGSPGTLDSSPSCRRRWPSSKTAWRERRHALQ